MGTRLIAREAVAVDTLARLAISRRSIVLDVKFCLSGSIRKKRDSKRGQTFANLNNVVYDFPSNHASSTRCFTVDFF